MAYACNLIIDSCCDLPFDIVNREGVQLIEFPYFFDDEEHLDDLWQSTTPREFYDRMRKGAMPHTAQASLAALTEAFTKAAQAGIPTVYLSFASALSASYDQACLMASQTLQEYPEFELYVVDTKLAAVGEGVLVFEALHQQERGFTAKQIVDWAEEARNFVNTYFMVEDLETLRRGGRIPSTVAVVGSKLDVKPILYIAADGSLAMRGVARGRKKGLKQLAQFFFDRADENAVPFVSTGNADCPKDAERIHDIIEKAGHKPLFVDTQVGPVIGSHVGPGMVAISFWGQDRREDISISDRIARKVRKAE